MVLENVNYFFSWILNNFVIPIIAIIFLVLFFVAQYYLIKIYIYLIKNVIGKVINWYQKLVQNKHMNKLINKFKENLI